MSSHNVYVAARFPKEEPFILRIRNVMAAWLFFVAHTRRGRANLWRKAHRPDRARPYPLRRPALSGILCLPKEPFVCPGSVF
jgi:hypothetical protein